MNDTTEPLANLLALAGAARVRFWPEDGKIHHRSPDQITQQLRELVLANKPVLLEPLAVWNVTEASRLQREADALVSELGVPGADAEIQRAAMLCVESHHREVMAGVRKGCALVEDRARKLGARAAQSQGEAA